MIDRTHALPITRQAAALGISRGAVYYTPRPTSVFGLAVVYRTSIGTRHGRITTRSLFHDGTTSSPHDFKFCRSHPGSGSRSISSSRCSARSREATDLEHAPCAVDPIR